MSTISILLTFYSDEKFIGQAIDACLRQTFTDFELILFNHASTDSSPQIVKSYSDPRIKYFETDKNLGAGSCLNFSKCFSYMTGKYIKLLCADDIMYDNCLYDLYTYMESNPEKDMCFADMQYIDENGNAVKPETENGFKLETLVLDMVHMMDNCLAYEVVREKEFAPIKNKTGVDSVESARELLKLNGVTL